MKIPGKGWQFSDRKQISGCLEGLAGGKGWEGEITKGLKETFWGDGYVHYLDCDNGFMGVYMSKQKCTF